MADVSYPVPLLAQPDKLSCWCASMAMLVSFRRQTTYAPEQLAQDVNFSLRTSYDWDALEAVKNQFGFQDISLPSNASLYPTPQQWSDWLTANGPLWITTVGDPSHAIVLRGLTGDLTADGTTAHINDPWDATTTFTDDEIDFSPANAGRAYDQSFTDLAADFGNLDLSDYGSWRVLFLPTPSGS